MLGGNSDFLFCFASKETFLISFFVDVFQVPLESGVVGQKVSKQVLHQWLHIPASGLWVSQVAPSSSGSPFPSSETLARAEGTFLSSSLQPGEAESPWASWVTHVPLSLLAGHAPSRGEPKRQ